MYGVSFRPSRHMPSETPRERGKSRHGRLVSSSPSDSSDSESSVDSSVTSEWRASKCRRRYSQLRSPRSGSHSRSRSPSRSEKGKEKGKGRKKEKSHDHDRKMRKERRREKEREERRSVLTGKKEIPNIHD
ncbi:hypothetical protein BDQ17DRAFT_1435081 [Cyathus striatus]|nr:hypothetical protein BDQ17DRAFT_1435081 [Cyathus striatus]